MQDKKKNKKRKGVQEEVVKQKKAVATADPIPVKKKKKKQKKAVEEWVPENAKRKAVSYPPLNGNELLEIHRAVWAAEPRLARPFDASLKTKEQERLYYETEDPEVRSYTTAAYLHHWLHVCTTGCTNGDCLNACLLFG